MYWLYYDCCIYIFQDYGRIIYDSKMEWFDKLDKYLREFVKMHIKSLDLRKNCNIKEFFIDVYDEYINW